MGEKNQKLIILLILGLLVHQHRVNGFIFTAITLISLAWTAYEIANEIHDTYNKVTTASTDDIMEKMQELTDSLDQWGTQIEDKIQQSKDMLLSRLPLLDQISSDVNLLNEYIGRIDELYTDLKDYMTYPQFFNNESLRDLVKTFTSRDGDDAQGTIAQLHNLIVPGRTSKFKKSLFLLLAQQTREYGLDICDTGASPQQRLVDLFDLAMESEMRVLAMYSFGLMMREYTDGEDLTTDLKRNHRKVLARAKQYMEVLKNTVSLAARQFRRCDPTEPRIRGIDSTDAGFEDFLQGFVCSEGILSSKDRCSKECSSYPVPLTISYGCEGYQCFVTYNGCHGRLTECQSLHGSATVCEYSGYTARRYQWVKDGEGTVMGDDSDGCPGDLENPETTMFKGQSCDVCRCSCIDDTITATATRSVNMREQVTDVADNMVAIGMKFEVKRRMIYIKLKQGKLGPGAEIDPDSIDWIEPEFIKEDFMGTFTNGELSFLKKTPGSADEPLVFDVDFANLNWTERRFNLDTISLEENYIVTGVRLRRNHDEEARPIQLEVQGTRFEAETGQLDLESSRWFTGEDMPYSKKFSKKDRVPFKTPEETRSPYQSSKTVINTKPYTYIDLTHTSWQFDAAQTTIPIMDGEPIVSDPAFPLVGVGLYHKAQPGYGGFLTFVLEGIDIGPYIPDDIEEEDDD